MIHVLEQVLVKVIGRVNELRTQALSERSLLPCLADRRVLLACLLFDAKAAASRRRGAPDRCELRPSQGVAGRPWNLLSGERDS
jgi:hypothetical protein